MSSPKYTEKQNMRHNGNSFENTELSPNMEDYMETISRLATKNRVVRVRDIARSLNITMPSVTAALGRLKEKKLILYEKYGHVELTTEGQKIADAAYRKHSFLREFFHDVLRMSRDTADAKLRRAPSFAGPPPDVRFVPLRITWTPAKIRKTYGLSCCAQRPPGGDAGDRPHCGKARAKTPYGNGIPQRRTAQGDKIRAAARPDRAENQRVLHFTEN